MLSDERQNLGEKIKREVGEEKKKKRRMAWQEGSERAAAVISLQDRKV